MSHFVTKPNITAAGNNKVCVPTAEKTAAFRKITKVAANGTCFDCPNTRREWKGKERKGKERKGKAALLSRCMCAAVAASSSSYSLRSP